MDGRSPGVKAAQEITLGKEGVGGGGEAGVNPARASVMRKRSGGGGG